jgi:hypothetical protein
MPACEIRSDSRNGREQSIAISDQLRGIRGILQLEKRKMVDAARPEWRCRIKCSIGNPATG